MVANRLPWTVSSLGFSDSTWTVLFSHCSVQRSFVAKIHFMWQTFCRGYVRSFLFPDLEDRRHWILQFQRRAGPPRTRGKTTSGASPCYRWDCLISAWPRFTKMAGTLRKLPVSRWASASLYSRHSGCASFTFVCKSGNSRCLADHTWRWWRRNNGTNV